MVLAFMQLRAHPAAGSPVPDLHVLQGSAERVPRVPWHLINSSLNGKIQARHVLLIVLN